MKYIFVINAGSSSLKFELFSLPKLNSVIEGNIDSITADEHERLIPKIIDIFLNERVIKNKEEIVAVGHRVVHGGEKYSKPVAITPKVFSDLQKLSKLAPLHNPINLNGIRAATKVLPNAKQVAVFDTAFHQTMPEKAFLYAVPETLYKKYGIRRFGFHGTSHGYVYNQARTKLGAAKTRNTVTCHLGNGASLCAIKNGKSVDTSMGFTPLPGIPMGTRSGDIDPAIIFHLMRNGWSAEKVEKMLEKESGLLGLCGDWDMRKIRVRAQKKDKRAILAIDLYSYKIAQYIGQYAVSLGGVDCLVFTGALGENAFYVRKAVLKYLKHLKIKNVLIIPTDEELSIAEQTKKIIGSTK